MSRRTVRRSRYHRSMSYRATGLAIVLAAAPCCVLLGSGGCVGDIAQIPETNADASNPNGGDASSNPDTTTGGPDTSTGGSDGGGGDTSVPPTDGSSSTDTGTDTGVDAGPACDPTKPFATPVPVVELNTGAVEDGARISPSGTELLLMREDAVVGKRIYRFTRTSAAAPWVFDAIQAPLNLVILADGGGATASDAVTLAPDGLTAYLASFRGNPWQIYFSQRAAIGQPWGQIAPVTGLASGGSDEFPWLNATGDRIYFMSNRAGPFRIYKSEKGVNGFAAATAIGAIRTDEDRAPVLSPDELRIYFAAFEIAPGASAKSMNIYTATRTAVGNLFTGSTYVTELNVPGQFSSPTWLSADGCEIYLTSFRNGSADIFSAKKPK
jgi:hypothetical protein